MENQNKTKAEHAFLCLTMVIALLLVLFIMMAMLAML